MVLDVSKQSAKFYQGDFSMKTQCFIVLFLTACFACMPNYVLGQGKCETLLANCNRDKGAAQTRLNNCVAREKRQKQRADDAEVQVSQLQGDLSNTKSTLANETNRANTEKARADKNDVQIRLLQSDLSITKSTLTGETNRANTEKARADKSDGQVKQLQSDLTLEKSKLVNETIRANVEKAKADKFEAQAKQLQTDLNTEKSKSSNESKRANTAELKIKELENKIPRVVISKVWIEYNIKKENADGILIHIKFDAYNLLNSECKMAVYFYTKNGIALVDKNGSYNTSDGKIAYMVTFKPTYIRSVYSDFQIFMPYSELHQATGKNELKFNLRPYRSGNETEFFDKSADYPFTVTVP